MNPIIEFRDVQKQFGSTQVLKGMELQLEQGKVSSLLGTNGAGKTTAISILLNLLKPTHGQVRVMGAPPSDKELRQRVGALMQEVRPPDGLRVGEILRLFRSYYRQPLPYEHLLDLCGLHKEANQRATSLSGGQRRRLAFAQCMAGDPELIVLDEPTTGMDVESRIRFWEVIRTLAASKRKTILLTTHHLEEADAVSDDIAVLMDGRIAAQGSPADLKAELSWRSLSFRTREPLPDGTFDTWPGIERVERDGDRIRLYAKETDALLPMLLAAGWPITEIEVNSASLESAFRQITEKKGVSL